MVSIQHGPHFQCFWNHFRKVLKMFHLQWKPFHLQLDMLTLLYNISNTVVDRALENLVARQLYPILLTVIYEHQHGFMRIMR